MESPITTVKSAINLSFLLKFLVGFMIVNAVLELTGLYYYVFQPLGSFFPDFKAKFARSPNRE